jgi:hypothetical protein
LNYQENGRWGRYVVLMVCGNQLSKYLDCKSITESSSVVRHTEWEYTLLIKENLNLVWQVTSLKAFFENNRCVGLSKEDRIYKMFQDMVNNGTGSILVLKKKHRLNRQ